MSRKIDLYLYIQQHTKQPITSFDAIDTKINYIKKQTEIKKVDKLNRGTFTLWNKQVKQKGNEITLPLFSLNELPKLLISSNKPITSLQFNIGEYLTKTSIFCNIYYEDKTKENIKVKDKQLVEILEKAVIECNLTTNWFLENTEQKQKTNPKINEDLLFYKTFNILKNDIDLKVLKTVYDKITDEQLKKIYFNVCKAIQDIKQSYCELVN